MEWRARLAAARGPGGRTMATAGRRGQRAGAGVDT